MVGGATERKPPSSGDQVPVPCGWCVARSPPGVQSHLPRHRPPPGLSDLQREDQETERLQAHRGLRLRHLHHQRRPHYRGVFCH